MANNGKTKKRCLAPAQARCDATRCDASANGAFEREPVGGHPGSDLTSEPLRDADRVAEPERAPVHVSLDTAAASVSGRKHAALVLGRALPALWTAAGGGANRPHAYQAIEAHRKVRHGNANSLTARAICRDSTSECRTLPE